MTQPRPTRIATTFGVAWLSLCFTTVALAQQQVVRPAKTNLWIDVSTGSMAGMPEMEGTAMGGVAGMLGGLMGGGRGGGGSGGMGGALTSYGQARGMSMMPSRVMDIALLNTLRPGVEANQAIPAGLKMGEALPLQPPARAESVREYDEKEHERAPTERGEPPKGRILIYWGCGETVRSGQPRVINLAGNPAQFGSAFSGRYAPDRSVRVSDKHALYPNEKNSVNLSKDSSLVGEHQIKGDGVPASMRFSLGPAQDVMPAIMLQANGAPTDSIGLSWQSLPHAKAYFISAFASQGDDMVLWSSSEIADVGMGLFDYLPNATIDRWLRERVLLAPATQQCAVPKGIFASPAGSRNEGGAMAQMIAFGGESYIVHPPRPTDPKTPWDQEWAVRVRTKAQTMASLGESSSRASRGAPAAPAPGAPTAANQAPAEPAQGAAPLIPGLPGAVNLLKGLFGR